MSRVDASRPRIAFLCWWLGLVIATGLVLRGALGLEVSRLPPKTPFDGTRSGHAEQWRFLDAASHLVPEGATFTIHAADPETEMSLYMMSVGLLPESTAIPATYWGQAVAASGRARFVLTFEPDKRDTAAPDRSVALPGGFLTDRALTP